MRWVITIYRYGAGGNDILRKLGSHQLARTVFFILNCGMYFFKPPGIYPIRARELALWWGRKPHEKFRLVFRERINERRSTQEKKKNEEKKKTITPGFGSQGYATWMLACNPSYFPQRKISTSCSLYLVGSEDIIVTIFAKVHVGMHALVHALAAGGWPKLSDDDKHPIDYRHFPRVLCMERAMSKR